VARGAGRSLRRASAAPYGTAGRVRHPGAPGRPVPLEAVMRSSHQPTGRRPKRLMHRPPLARPTGTGTRPAIARQLRMEVVGVDVVVSRCTPQPAAGQQVTPAASAAPRGAWPAGIEPTTVARYLATRSYPRSGDRGASTRPKPAQRQSLAGHPSPPPGGTPLPASARAGDVSPSPPVGLAGAHDLRVWSRTPVTISRVVADTTHRRWSPRNLGREPPVPNRGGRRHGRLSALQRTASPGAKGVPARNASRGPPHP